MIKQSTLDKWVLNPFTFWSLKVKSVSGHSLGGYKQMKDKYNAKYLARMMQESVDEKQSEVSYDEHGRMRNSNLTGSKGNWEHVEDLQQKITWNDIYELQEFINNISHGLNGCFPNNIWYHIDYPGCEEGGIWDAYIESVSYGSVTFGGSVGPGTGCCLSKTDNTGTIFTVCVGSVIAKISKSTCNSVIVQVEFSNPVGLRFAQKIGLL